ncbi:MAG: calcium-binding protein [Solirubrobacterales bacterium]
MGRMKRGLLGVVAALACGLVVAPSALASTVTVTGGNTIRVAETGNEINQIAVKFGAGTDVYTIADAAANLTPSGMTCTAVDAHTATCPGAGIKEIVVATDERDDSIALDPGTIPSTVKETLGGCAGSDSVSGANSPGTLHGGTGNDSVTGTGTLFGDAGNDTITGTSAAETLRGNGGRDVLDGGDGPDDIGGGSGIDTLLYPASRQTPINVSVGLGDGNDGGVEDQGAGGRRDTVRGDVEGVVGTVASDVLIGDNSSESLLGLTGDDLLVGNGGSDFLGGFEGNDLMSGGTGNDTERGSFGNDRELGGPGNDRLAGGPDDDFIKGKLGSDIMKGKTGIDTIRARDHIHDVKINCGPGPNGAESATRDRRLDPPAKSC